MTLVKLFWSFSVLLALVINVVLTTKPNPLPSFPKISPILNREHVFPPISLPPFGSSMKPAASVSLPAFSTKATPVQSSTTTTTPAPPPPPSSPSPLPSQESSASSENQSSAPPATGPSPSLGLRKPFVLTPEHITLLDRFMGPYKGRQNVRILYDTDFQYRCLDAMNRKRLWHENTPQLVLGDNFTQYTLDRAWSILSDIAEGKREIVKGRYPFGESFFWYYDPNRYRTVEEAINTWYEEERHYDYDNPGFSARTGGFTQLVWRGSREATCVKIEFETPHNYKTLIVANFWPAGNVKGEFPSNVMPLRTARPDMDQGSQRRPERPWPRPPYRPTPEPPSYPTHPLYKHGIFKMPHSLMKK